MQDPQTKPRQPTWGEYLHDALWVLAFIAMGAAPAYPMGYRGGWNAAANEAREARKIEQELARPAPDPDTANAIVVAQAFIRQSAAKPETVKFGKFLAVPVVGVSLEYSAQAPDGTEVADKREIFIANGSIVAVNPPLPTPPKAAP